MCSGELVGLGRLEPSVHATLCADLCQDAVGERPLLAARLSMGNSSSDSQEPVLQSSRSPGPKAGGFGPWSGRGKDRGLKLSKSPLEPHDGADDDLCEPHLQGQADRADPHVLLC